MSYKATTAITKPTHSHVYTYIVMAICCLLLAAYSLASGTIELSMNQVFSALSGQSSKLHDMVINQWRMPRVVMALIFGAGLGMSGAIFQSLIRNPLGSPDLIGFNAGAHSGALITIIVLNGSALQITVNAVLGGLLTAAVIYLLSFRQGISSIRLILIGVGLNAVLSAVNHWLVTSTDLATAMQGAIWGSGSLNGISWSKALLPAVVAIAAMVCALGLQRQMKMMEMGDDLATSLGVNTEKVRAILFLLAIVMSACATASAGPIAFVALAAPQLAKLITRSQSISLTASMLTGAFLLVSCDLIARVAFHPQQLPVGVITVSLGGFYLLWLLLYQANKNQ